MAISEYRTGSATISTTEYSLVNASTTLASDTTDGVFQIYIAIDGLTGDDLYEFDVKEKIRTSDIQQSVFVGTINAGNSFMTLPTMIFLHGWDVTVTKLAGTDRTVRWSIRQVA